MNEYMAVKLGHLTSTAPAIGPRSGWKETYTTQTMSLERPNKGKKAHQVTCAACGQSVVITTASPGAVAMQRLGYRGVSAALLLFSALVFTGVLGGLRPGAITTGQACLGALAFFAILGAIGLIAQSFQSDSALALSIAGPEGHAIIHSEP